jgi:hypothetical protein
MTTALQIIFLVRVLDVHAAYTGLLIGAGRVAGFAFAPVLYSITQLSYRQVICPPELLGRMNAAIRWIVWGTLPLGAVIGTALGVRPKPACNLVHEKS